jgi:hypothetical protein
VLGEHAGKKGGDSLGEQGSDCPGEQIGGEVLGEHAGKNGGDSLAEQIGTRCWASCRRSITGGMDGLGGDALGNTRAILAWATKLSSILVQTVSGVISYIPAVFGAVGKF